MAQSCHGVVKQLSSRGFALLLLENDAQFVKLARQSSHGGRILASVATAAGRIAGPPNGDVGMRIIGDRHDLAITTFTLALALLVGGGANWAIKAMGL